MIVIVSAVFVVTSVCRKHLLKSLFIRCADHQHDALIDRAHHHSIVPLPAMMRRAAGKFLPLSWKPLQCIFRQDEDRNIAAVDLAHEISRFTFSESANARAPNEETRIVSGRASNRKAHPLSEIVLYIEI